MKITTPHGTLEGDNIEAILKEHGYDCLHGADLGHADLHGADLHGANLSDADLRDADLRYWTELTYGVNLFSGYRHWSELVKDFQDSAFPLIPLNFSGMPVIAKALADND